VRRAETTVELASGQSFAIAGLFQNNSSNQIQRFPAGRHSHSGHVVSLHELSAQRERARDHRHALHRATGSVTADLHLPTDGLVLASDFERIVLGRLTARSAGAAASGASPAQGVPHLQAMPGHVGAITMKDP